MKFKFLFSLLLGSAITMSAQGYKDGIEYYKADQFENAKTILTRTLNDASTDKAEANYYLGAIALHNGDKATAEACFNAGIAANPAYAFNYVGKGELALKSGNEKAADDFFKKARDYGKKDAEVYTEIGRAYYNVDPVKYAEDITKSIEKAKKTNKKDASNLIFQGDMKADQKAAGEAAALYENAILYDAENSAAYVKYANVYFAVSPAYAIQKLEQLLELQPNSALAQRELAEKYYQNDQWAKAAVAYGKYIENPNHFTEDEVRYSVLLYYGQRYQQSLELAEKLLKNDPKNFQLQRIVLLDKAALKDFAGAENQAIIFFALKDPKNKYTATDYSTYGDVLKELGKDSLSLIQYEKAVEVNPDKVDLVKQLSSAYNAVKKYEKAAQIYQKVIDSGDYKTNDLYVLAGRYMSHAATETDSLKKIAAFDNAFKYIDLTLAKVSDDYRIHQRKARLYLTQSGPSEASTDCYVTVLALLDKDPSNKEARKGDYTEAYNYIAAHFLKIGDVAKAKEFYLKYLELEPQNEALRKYVDSLKVEEK